MPFEWILFDADHTLFDFDRSAEESLMDTMRAHGVTPQVGHWELYNRINKQCWTAYENGEIDRETMRTKRFALFFGQIGAVVSDINAFATEYLQGLPGRPYFIPGATKILGHLHTRIRLGLITNGLAEVQRPRLAATGIDKYFEVIVVSGEVGFMKPDHAYFEYTYMQMARPVKSNVLVIGDSLNADIRGASGFGFRTCWFNPAAAANDSGIAPDYEIDDLHKIPEIVGIH